MRPERVLYLAVLAQAVYDVLLDEESNEATESAWLFLSGHATLLKKLRRLSTEEKRAWRGKLQEALDE